MSKWLSRKFVTMIWGSVLVPALSAILAGYGLPASAISWIIASLAGVLGIYIAGQSFVDGMAVKDVTNPSVLKTPPQTP